MTLSPDITIEYPDNYHVDPTRAITWSQEKRADELRDTTLRFMEKMCTDIYTLVDKRDKKKVLVFNQSDEALVTFSVKVNRDEKEDGYRYEARIKNKSNWVSRVARCEVLLYVYMYVQTMLSDSNECLKKQLPNDSKNLCHNTCLHAQ